jgi:hypothetical protein
MDRKEVNREELAICKRRGHELHLEADWQQCKLCGLWVRTVTTIEEREDEPPEDEQIPLDLLEKIQDQDSKDGEDEKK